ncbi:MAG: right-handed parallel beta-helix repeat-containing protein [Sedimentisphaerales bacterium]|nr:right-handed parallel beta-helix repeat-containing protein [Sedimentisphaerales bacterium]
MKAELSTIVLILTILFVASGISYGCYKPPAVPKAVLIDDPDPVFPGASVNLDGSGSSGSGGIIKYEWDWTDDGIYDYYETSSYHPDGAFDGETLYTYPSIGTYTARLRVTEGYRLHRQRTNTCTVHVVRVKNITQGTGHNTIQDALDNANNGDTLVASDGIYYEAIDPNGVSCTLRSIDPDNPNIIDATIIDANSASSYGVTFSSSEDANFVLRGFTITGGARGIYCAATSPTISNCVITNNQNDYDGAGIYCTDSASPNITNCILSDNSASGDGGGMYNYNSSPSLTNCTFSNNSAFRGGGVYNNFFSNPAMSNCIFTGNSSNCFALGNAYGGGGMFNCGSSPTLANCTFTVNTADNMAGGMLNHDSSNPTLTNCTFSENYADYDGGGMLNHDSSNPIVISCIFTGNTAGWYGGGMHNIDSYPTVTNCIFNSNEAEDGGAINNDYSSPSVINCIISGNHTYTDGGGMYNYRSSPAVINCTFSGNQADNHGGGMHNYDSPSMPKVTNCILWSNEAGISGDEVYNDSSADPNFRYCDIEGCGGSAAWDISFGTDGGGNIDNDPTFVNADSLFGQDGVFGTYDDGLRVKVHSSCVDTADATVGGFKLTDVTGHARIDVGYVDNKGVGDPNYADIGAYESQTIWFVDKDASGGANDGSSWDDAFTDLQSALAVADGNDNAEIWVAEGTYKPTDGSDRSISFELVANVGVYGGFAGTETLRYERDWTENETKLSGDIGTVDVQSDNSYHVVKGAEGAVLDGFTITGGKANGSGDDRYGGGMFNSGCSPTVMHCFFSGNSSSNYGGSMCNRNCVCPIVMNCTFSGNSSGFGGGIANFPSCPELINCTFTGNVASLCGGGMSNTYSHEGPSDPTVTNCIFWANSAGDYDEIYNDDFTYPTVSYCDIEGCGGSTAWDPNFGTDGGGNIDSDPIFYDADSPAGEDGVFGTFDDGLRLSDLNSPCIDAADGDAAPSYDILSQPRFDINEVDNTGTGDPDYADIGAYEFTYAVDLTVTEVRIYTSTDYSDNDGDGLNDCQVHFGHKDGSGSYAYPNLYIEVDATGGCGWNIDEDTLYVTSDSDSTGIEVDFQETGINTNKYRSINPIHLSTDSNQLNLELKVLDEETLYVDSVNGPKVDRGEVATITANVASVPQYMADDGADAVENFLCGICFWPNVGEERAITSSVFPNFVKDVGNTGLSFPADFLFQCSHGGSGNFGYWHSGEGVLYKPGSGSSPTITSSDWGKDIEWAVFYSCHVLGQYRSSSPDAWITYWDDALIRGPDENNAHGILASADVLWANPTKTHMQKMCNYLKGNTKKVIDAYMDSALEVSPMQTNASALFHEDNLDDYLDNTTPDTDDPDMYYTYYAYYEEDPNAPDPNDPNSVWSAGRSATEYTPSTGIGCEVLCTIPTDQPQLARVLVHKEVLTGNALDYTASDEVDFDNTGRVRFKKHLHESGPIQLSKAQACAKADSFLAQKGGGKPVDAELVGVIQQMGVSYNALAPENTWNEYVEKAFFEYGHKVDGIRVTGGNRGDSICVGVAGNQVVSLNRHWRNIVGPIGGSLQQQVISASDALDVAVENVPRVIILPLDGGYAITEIKLFYHGLPSEEEQQYLTPAWGFKVNNSLWVYVDAFTGQFLD